MPFDCAKPLERVGKFTGGFSLLNLNEQENRRICCVDFFSVFEKCSFPVILYIVKFFFIKTH